MCLTDECFVQAVLVKSPASAMASPIVISLYEQSDLRSTTDLFQSQSLNIILLSAAT